MRAHEITDSDVQLLADRADALATNYVSGPDDPWEGSPFKWILSIPSRSKGAVGEALVDGWCAAKGFDVVRTGDSEADREIEGHRVEIKFSTLDTRPIREPSPFGSQLSRLSGDRREGVVVDNSHAVALGNGCYEEVGEGTRQSSPKDQRFGETSSARCQSMSSIGSHS